LIFNLLATSSIKLNLNQKPILLIWLKLWSQTASTALLAGGDNSTAETHSY